MKDQKKTKTQLMEELAEMRQRIAELEAADTERKRTEQMLAESEAKYRALVDHAPVGVIQTSASTGEIFFVNDAALRIFEFDSKEEFLAQRSPTRWKHPEEREHFVQLLREHGEVRDFEAEALTKTDQTKTVIISTKANGDWLLSTVLDITERKRVEEQFLRQNAVLNATDKVFQETLLCESEEEFARRCLALAEELSGSKFGFMCEINQAGHFDTIAISDPGWEACRIPKTNAVLMLNDLEIRGIRGRVVEDKQAMIFNDPATHPDWIEPPEGHPRIICFLGVPLKHADQTIGMIGLANKEGGYDLDDQQVIESLSLAFVEALLRKRAEEALAQRVEELESFHRLAVGRELRMIELKRQVNELSEQLGKEPPYALSILEGDGEYDQEEEG